MEIDLKLLSKMKKKKKKKKYRDKRLECLINSTPQINIA